MEEFDRMRFFGSSAGTSSGLPETGDLEDLDVFELLGFGALALLRAVPDGGGGEVIAAAAVAGAGASS